MDKESPSSWPLLCDGALICGCVFFLCREIEPLPKNIHSWALWWKLWVCLTSAVKLWTSDERLNERGMTERWERGEREMGQMGRGWESNERQMGWRGSGDGWRREGGRYSRTGWRWDVMGQHVTHLPTNSDALKWNYIWSQGACCLILN